MNIQDFNKEVLSYKSSLQPFAISLTHNSEDAKDLYQETIFKALSNRDKYTDNTNLKAWLFTIMKNIFINNYKKLTKKREVLSLVNKQMMAQSAYNVNNGYANLRLQEVNKALDELKDIYRVPFQLYYAGYKYQEISEKLNEPIGTIKSRIFLARKQLKDTLVR